VQGNPLGLAICRSLTMRFTSRLWATSPSPGWPTS
jgi:hypothetical protein